MAEGDLVNQAVSTSAQVASGHDQEDQGYVSNSRLQQMLGGYGGMESPQYGGVAPGMGALPARDGGFEQFLEHQLGSAKWAGSQDGTGPSAKIVGGEFDGMTHAQAHEAIRDKYAQMSPQDRAPWEQRAFLQNDRSQKEMQRGNFQYPSQSAMYAPKGPSWADVDRGGTTSAPQYQSSDIGGPEPRATLMQPGQPGANGSRMGVVNFNPGSITQGDNDTRPHYGVGAAATSVIQPSVHQSDATPTGQQFTRVGLGSVPNVVQPSDASYYASHPDFIVRPMGNPNDTARFGPAVTNQNAPSYIGQVAGRNGSTVPQIGSGPQLPKFDASGTLVTAPPQQLRYDSGGTLISPLDKPGVAYRPAAPPVRALPAPPPAYANAGR